MMDLLDSQGARDDGKKFLIDFYRTSFQCISFSALIDRVVETGVVSGEISPQDGWRDGVHVGKYARISYRFRVRCDAFYGNVSCQTYCKPRNDGFGHWYCSAESEKVCLDGWIGSNCDKGEI